MTNDTLNDLLDASQSLPPEYRDGLSSHLPMALQALHAMGAGPQRMRDFVQHYAARFSREQVVSEAFAALRGRYADDIAKRGADAALRAALPALWPGVSAAALHGVIRTAHAVASGHAGELAQGLAYWAWRWQGLPAPDAQTAPMAFNGWADALAQAGDGWRADTRLISAGMRLAGVSAAYHSLAGRLTSSEQTLPALSRWAALRYAQTGNFTVLHLVTGCRAARVLMPWAADPAVAATHLVQAFTAGYLASGVGSAVTAAPPLRVGWDAVITAACASNDDHVIKLVQACRDQALALETQADDGPWLHAARRAVAQSA
jgi:hypothetical protein